jgi:hypothetical protein
MTLWTASVLHRRASYAVGALHRSKPSIRALKREPAVGAGNNERCSCAYSCRKTGPRRRALSVLAIEMRHLGWIVARARNPIRGHRGLDLREIVGAET